jgi:tRNA(Ile)-lysidine synthase
MRLLALAGRAGQKLELAQGLRAERTHRELRLTAGPVAEAGKPGNRQDGAEPPPEYAGTVPGEIDAPAFGLHLRINLSVNGVASGGQGSAGALHATLRNWRPGDRVTLRYSSGPRKVKEVLERLRVTGTSRSRWPVLELDGRIVWMRGVELQPEPGIAFEARFFDGTANQPPQQAASGND